MNKSFSIILLLVLFNSLSLTIAKSSVFFNVLDYGALGKGLETETTSIQKAIDACAATGGGQVYFPAGTYITGTLYLKDNVYIYLSPGAIILGSTDIADYPANYPEIEFYSRERLHFALIYAENCTNTGIEGHGTIDGRGAAFTDKSPLHPEHYRARPYLLWFISCKNVRIQHVKLRNAGYWMQHYLACEDILIDGISVYNHCNKNNDMLDIDGCRNVRITNVTGDSDDDGITLKSTHHRPVENVVISNCIISTHCNAIKTGTESNGGFRNISISNCIIKPSESKDSVIYGVRGGITGITLGLVDGGTLEGITIDNIRMEGVYVPIFMRLGNRGRAYKEGQGVITTGTFRDVHIRNIQASGANMLGCLLSGLPDHPIENVHLSDISLGFSGGAPPEATYAIVANNPDMYPDASRFRLTNAYGFHVRHAKNVSFTNINLQFDQEDARPAVVLEDVKDARIVNLSAMLSSKASSLLLIRNGKSIGLHYNRAKITGLRHAGVMVQIEGLNNENIVLSGNEAQIFNGLFNSEANGVVHEVSNFK
ncbi:MAG: glycoside hydrolase [Cyclobacteriaceae bacterium]|nr:glycoside hydrolase [Cyclobacteriaceae bacterium]